MTARIVCHGTVRVAAAPADALRLFTPAGEREWTEGWDPAFPAQDADDSAPGTVFTTHAEGGGHAIWIIAARTEDSLRYARTVPGRSAGTVEVRCEPAGEATVAHVTYDLTALDDAERPRLAAFAERYESFLSGWEKEIAAALRRLD